MGLSILSILALAINVAAASDLSFPIKEIIQAFQQQTGTEVRLTLGSSGNFFNLIQNGAPFDVFLSADMNYPQQLEKGGQAVQGSTFIYGIGSIVLWIPKNSPLKIETLGMQALLDSQVKKISIANPAYAPYGRAAEAALKAAGVYDRVKSKLVLGENISQTAQFVQSGAADVGIIAHSLASSEPMAGGRQWQIPQNLYPRLEQGAVLLKHGGPEAKAFEQYLESPAAQKIFEKYGFTPDKK